MIVYLASYPRSGSVDEWRTGFSSTQLELLRERHGGQMARSGYAMPGVA